MAEEKQLSGTVFIVPVLSICANVGASYGQSELIKLISLNVSLSVMLLIH